MLTPETIKILDPACGSGHILVEAYDVLKAIYEEQGYEPKAIPRLILEKNLYGLDIDDRAAQLAAFALMMKARADDRRIFTNPPKLNILSLQSTEKLNLAQLWHKLDLYKEGKIGATSSLFEEPQLNLTDEINRQEYKMLAEILPLFVEAKTFGSLIQIPEKYEKPLADLLAQLENLVIHGDTFQTNAAKTLIPYIKQAHILAMKFDAVVANPPYMGGKGMNGALKDFAKKHFPDSKSDMFSMFMERCQDFGNDAASLSFVTPYVWMFISSYEGIRTKLLNNATLQSLIQLEYNAFEPACVPVCTFIVGKTHIPNYTGSYIKLSDFKGHENQAPKTLEAIKNPNCGWFYNAKPDDFKKISGSPVAYWLSSQTYKIFTTYKTVGDVSSIRAGMATGDNESHIRLWYEIHYSKFAKNTNSAEHLWKCEDKKWIPFNKGGEFRKWFGNLNYVINYDKKSYDLLKQSGNKCPSESYYFRESLTWSDVTSSTFSLRYFPSGGVFSTVGNSIFQEEIPLYVLGCNLMSSPINAWLKIINPTLHANPGDISKIPFCNNAVSDSEMRRIWETGIFLAKTDWNNYETSWDFTDNPLIRQKQQQTVRPELVEGQHHADEFMLRQAQHERFNLDQHERLNLDQHERFNSIEACFNAWKKENRAAIDEMKRLEEENNRLFIEAYGLQDELSHDVPEEQITLVRADREKDCRDFISYAVGCLFGRYSLDKTGLILASQGETLDDYLKQIPQPTLTPCENNVLPILDGDWFSDDLSERFREFLRVSFGENHYEENLTFIEESLGKKIGQYFVKDFYNDHIKRYKKRPIYWLFSSPKGSFNALIYLHRYRPDTVSVVLNEYLREFRTKLTAHKTHLEAISIRANATQSEKTKALKEIEKFKKILLELETYEREVLYPLATQQIDIDLDDGVKANYPKFGAALKKIPGLDRVEE